MADHKQTSTETRDGRWSKEEHQKFIMGLQLYGRNWKEISKLVATRTGSQIRSHAQKYFDKVKKTSSDKEETLERNSFAQESPSFDRDESTTNYSYYLNEISKFSMEIGEFKFWDQLIGVEPTNFSLGSTIVEQKLKVSFKPYNQSDQQERQADTFEPIILNQSN